LKKDFCWSSPLPVLIAVNRLHVFVLICKKWKQPWIIVRAVTKWWFSNNTLYPTTTPLYK